MKIQEKQDIFKIIFSNRKAIMGFCALSIFFFHLYRPIFSDVEYVVFIQKAIVGYGYIGVDIFFFLSGMGSVFSIEKYALHTFYFRRIKRLIFPFVVVAFIRMIDEKWSIQEFILNVLGINFFTKSIFSYLWFVPAIAILYLFFPFYYRLFIKCKNKLIFSLNAVLFITLLSFLLSSILRDDLYTFFNRIPIFLVGIYFGWSSKRKSLVISQSGWLFLLLSILLGIYLVAGYSVLGFPAIKSTFTKVGFPSILIAIPLTLILAVVFDKLANIKFGRVICKILAFYGIVSLEMYCIQECLGWKIIEFFNGRIGNFSVNLIVLIVVTLSSYLLFLFGQLFWRFCNFCKKKMRLVALILYNRS